MADGPLIIINNKIHYLDLKYYLPKYLDIIFYEDIISQTIGSLNERFLPNTNKFKFLGFIRCLS